MSFQSRLKNRREDLGISRAEMAKGLNVTVGAISNYENGVSSPKVDLLFKIFEILKCDANYLYQDNYKSVEFVCTLDEQEHIKKYRNLDEYGKKQVDTTLNNEYDRCNDDQHFVNYDDAMKFMQTNPRYAMGGMNPEKMDRDTLIEWANDFWKMEQKAKPYLD